MGFNRYKQKITPITNQRFSAGEFSFLGVVIIRFESCIKKEEFRQFLFKFYKSEIIFFTSSLDLPTRC
jgi:hypothetical protein